MSLLLGVFITLFGVSAAANNPPPVIAVPQFSSTAVPQLNSISGRVYDDLRNPIPDLQVELLDETDSLIKRTKTDRSGLFVFGGLANGVFKVRVETHSSNYISQTQSVELEITRSAERIDFVLTSKKTASQTPTLGAIFVQEVPERARKEFERGAVLMKSGQRQEGLAALKTAIEIFPAYFDALELLGVEHVKDREFEPAIPVLTKAIEVNSRSYASLYALSVAQYNLKQLPAANDSIRRALNLNQKSSNANLWLGMLLRHSDQLDEAETYLKHADQLAESKSPDVHWQLALLFQQRHRYQDAADELEVFLKIQPDARDKEMVKRLIQQLRQQSAGAKQ